MFICIYIILKKLFSNLFAKEVSNKFSMFIKKDDKRFFNEKNNNDYNTFNNDININMNSDINVKLDNKYSQFNRFALNYCRSSPNITLKNKNILFLGWRNSKSNFEVEYELDNNQKVIKSIN